MIDVCGILYQKFMKTFMAKDCANVISLNTVVLDSIGINKETMASGYLHF